MVNIVILIGLIYYAIKAIIKILKNKQKKNKGCGNCPYSNICH